MLLGFHSQAPFCHSRKGGNGVIAEDYCDSVFPFAGEGVAFLSLASDKNDGAVVEGSC